MDFDNSPAAKSGEQHAREIMYRLLPRGILAMPPKGNTLSFSIPLIIDEHDLDEALHLIGDELKSEVDC